MKRNCGFEKAVSLYMAKTGITDRKRAALMLKKILTKGGK
jgi:hypothetical protein